MGFERKPNFPIKIYNNNVPNSGLILGADASTT